MKWFGAPSILRPAIGSMADEELRNGPAKCSGRDMECGVAAVKIVADVGQEERSGPLSCRAKLRRGSCQSRVERQTMGHVVQRAAYDQPYEIEKDQSRAHNSECRTT